MMKKADFKKELDHLNVYSGFYSLEGELLPDRIVLYQNYSRWEVFYLDERGNREKENVFNSESEACNYMYELFKSSQ